MCYLVARYHYANAPEFIDECHALGVGAVVSTFEMVMINVIRTSRDQVENIMKLRNIALGMAALSLVAGPVVAQASLDRSSAPAEGESLEGENGILIAILAAAAIIAGIIIIADDDDDDEPTSP